jgi:hypothetical protein
VKKPCGSANEAISIVVCRLLGLLIVNVWKLIEEPVVAIAPNFDDRKLASY